MNMKKYLDIVGAIALIFSFSFFTTNAFGNRDNQITEMAIHAIVFGILVISLYFFSRYLAKHDTFKFFSNKPQLLICLIALFGTTLACFPVIFQNKSFISPGNGTLLVYDRQPTLPNYYDNSMENVHWADVGAMTVQHFPITVVQERSIKKHGEFPLWNRFNSSGTTMVGQGQMMLGDPSNWLIWLFGANAFSFDIKFVLLRIVFAASLGVSVFVITRSILASTIIAFTTPFIGFFLFRICHPSIFTLCYSPLILLAWLKIIYGDDYKNKTFWVVGLTVANWLVLNSGTVKEAYMTMIALNAIGFVHLFMEKRRLQPNFRTLTIALLASGICFLMMAYPIWGTLLNAIRVGSSLSHDITLEQYPLWTFIAFAENILNLSKDIDYVPAVNTLIFIGFIFGVFILFRNENNEQKRSAAAMAIGCLILFFISYGIFPEYWLDKIPFVKNIGHVHHTFLSTSIVPTCVLSGIGFARFDNGRRLGYSNRELLFAATIILTMVTLYHFKVYAIIEKGTLQHLVNRYIFLYVIIAFMSSFFIPRLVTNLIYGRLSPALITIFLILSASVLSRGAMLPRNYTLFPGELSEIIEHFSFNPRDRVDILQAPEIIDKIKEMVDLEPARVIGLGYVYTPGFNAVHDLENISGPDGVWNKEYRELTSALGIPYLHDWRIVLNQESLSTLSNQLDFFGVKYLLSSQPINNITNINYVGNDGIIGLYDRKTAWPRAFFTQNAYLHDGLQSLVEKIINNNDGPFVSIDRDTLKGNSSLHILLEHSRLNTKSFVKARDYNLTNNTTSFTIDVPTAGLVYLGETDEPGNFIATVNGISVPYIKANHSFKAIFIDKPGTYKICFRYLPENSKTYLLIAFVGLTAWILILIIMRKNFMRSA